jgi:hypothetical protein
MRHHADYVPIHPLIDPHEHRHVGHVTGRRPRPAPTDKLAFGAAALTASAIEFISDSSGAWRGIRFCFHPAKGRSPAARNGSGNGNRFEGITSKAAKVQANRRICR